MLPITVKAQLSFATYYKVNFFVLKRRFKWLILSYVILVLLCFLLAFVDRAKDLTFLYIGIGCILYAFLLPYAVYIGSRKNYRKVEAMREPKVYEFDETLIKLNGQIISSTMEWSHLDNVFERRSDILVLCANYKNFFSLPLTGFSSTEDIQDLKTLMKIKGVKNNFTD